MKSEIYWIKKTFPGKLALVPRPRGGEWLKDEIQNWKDADLDVIVSMIEDDEIRTFKLEDEAEFCEAIGIKFISFPVADRSVPHFDDKFLYLVENLKIHLLEGKNIAIHCRQSIGRAPLLAAILMNSLGVEFDDAFQELSEVRGISVPETLEQKEWAEKFAELTALISA